MESVPTRSLTTATAWWALTAMLAAVVLRIWHMVLMKEAIGQPLVLGAWIAAAWTIAAAMAICERRALVAGVPGPPRLWSGRTREFWIVLAVFSALLLLFHVGFVRAASDGRGYFAQVRSIVIDRDLDFTNDIQHFGARPTDANFPLGTALMWTPFFALAHAWLGVFNLFGADYARDGFWNPYQRAVGVGTFVYGGAAVLMIAAALRRWFDSGSAVVATLTILLATPVIWYVAVDSSMSHGVSLFTATGFLAVFLGTGAGRGRRDWLALSVLAALMTAVRPQNLLFLVALAVEALRVLRDDWRTHRDRARLLRRAAPYGLPCAAGLAVFALLAVPGPAETDPYVLDQEIFSRWRIVELLFSPFHGLISSSPVLAFAIAGLPLLYRRDRTLALGLIAAFLAQLAVNGTSRGWAGGAAFGARRFVECAMPFAFGLAAAIDFARQRPFAPIALLLGVLMAINVALVQDFRLGLVTQSEAVPFRRMVDAVTSRVGNPFALPFAMVFAWRHDVPLAQLDRMPAFALRNFRLDVGSERDAAFLLHGWLDRELDARRTFRWATGPEAVIFTRMAGDRDYRLRIVVEPLTWRGAPPQIVEVRLGQTLLGTLTLPPGFSQHELDIPRALTVPRAYARIAFRFAYARTPREVGLSDDTRRLAVRFDTIEILQRSSP
jgi:hypothetical protein